MGKAPRARRCCCGRTQTAKLTETRIYLYEGALREEYGTADAALDPQDSERIVDAKSFSVEQVRPGLLVVSDPNTEARISRCAAEGGLARMRRSRGGAAFYVETLLLVLFLLASLTVLVQDPGRCKAYLHREARELSTAVSIAQNAAELFAASGSREDFAALLGAEKRRGTLRAAATSRAVGRMKHRGLMSWKRRVGRNAAAGG